MQNMDEWMCASVDVCKRGGVHVEKGAIRGRPGAMEGACRIRCLRA
jgi:hypothetical protein